MKRNNVPRSETDASACEFFDYPSGCAFLMGFLAGFEVGSAGEGEPNIDEIKRVYCEAQQDSIFAIKPEARD